MNKLEKTMLSAMIVSIHMIIDNTDILVSICGVFIFLVAVAFFVFSEELEDE